MPTTITDITAAGATSISYDTFWTATIKNYGVEQLAKNFIKIRPIVEMAMDGFSKRDTAGGRVLQGSVDYGLNNVTKFFSGADTFAQEPSQFALPYIYQWRYLGSSVSFTKQEQLENSNQVALFNITEGRINQAMRTMNFVLGQELFSDGTNYGGQTIIGVAAGVSTTPATDPASGAVGGIPAATNTFWRNYATTSFGSFVANGVNGSSQDLVFNAFNSLTDGDSDGVTDIISDQTTYQFYNRALLATTRIVDPTRRKTGDLTFGALEYMGIPWKWDRQCPSGRIYLFNRKYLGCYVDPRFLFEWTAPLSYPNQLAFTRIVGLRLAMCYTSRMPQGVLDGVTA